MLRIISVEVGSAVMNCRNVNALLKKKLYQQFRLKKPGGAVKKLYQAIKDVNHGCSVTLPSRCRHAVDKNFNW